MQELKIIGVENGALLATSEDGDRFRIAIDDVLASHVKRSRPDPEDSAKVSPREIQTQIRQGLSAEDVADITGASVEYIQRFEGPIIAEREHIVSAALSVAVHTASDVDPLEPVTFGTAIRERLATLNATGERWASWKQEEGGWIVKLAFVVDDIDHDARWNYDQRKNALSPANSEAVTLSQQGEIRGSLIPRLRAVSDTTPDESRFDSGAFTFTEESDRSPAGPADAPMNIEPAALSRIVSSANNSIAITAIKRSEDAPKDQHQTADLLDALRRRRGEREAAIGAEETLQPATAKQDDLPVDLPLDDFADLEPTPRQPASLQDHASRSSGRKGRAAMPSWDEIVFGARTDDDPA